MSAKKTERLVNLVMALLDTRRFLTVEQIRAAVPGYGEPGDARAEEAFRRMFERDKEELRELGIPLETGSHSVWDDEPGYRIARRDYALPEVRLEPDEAAALGLAARLWASAGLAAASRRALAKLQAAGVEVGVGAGDDRADAVLAGTVGRVDAREPAFEPCLAAVRDGRAVRFDYRGAAGVATARRHVEPWGVVSWRGRWYLVGHDRDRAATRVFRLSRVVGAVQPVGPRGAVVPPEGVDLVAQVASLAGERGDLVARVRVRRGAAVDLRRDARGAVRPVPADPGQGPGDEEWDELEIVAPDAERLAERVCAHGPAAVVVDPPEVREAVVRRLRGVLASTGPPR